MLAELKVSNFAIIDEVQIQFDNGLNILSGETGAGKSVLLKSLALIMGEKASIDDIKTGAQQASIEGLFDLSSRPDIEQHLVEMGIEVEDHALIVRRTLQSNGKSKIYLNGSLSALNSLRDLISPLITVTGQTSPLIEMTGQHDNRHLQSKRYHLDTLDLFAGLWKDRQHVGERYAALVQVRRDIEQLKTSLQAREQRLDFLNYQKDELEALNIQPGEDEELLTRMGRLKNLNKLKTFCEEVEYQLHDSENSVLDQIKAMRTRAEELSVFDASFKDKFQNLSQAQTLVEDVLFEARGSLKEFESEPTQLENLEERYSHFRKLQKKYGETAEHMISALAEIRHEIESLQGSDDKLEALTQQEALAQLELKQLSQKLHKARKNAAREFQNLVNEELRELNMKGVELEVQITEEPELTATGSSEVEFMIRASKKDEPRSLSRYASGGELSRILLSIKQIVGNSDQPRTYLFDEVDTGVSGVTAEKVGRKLKAIAQGQQVICVTHLAQVAAFSDVHYLIEKQPSKRGTFMTVRQLNARERVDEIARLISGERITRTSLDHAKELLRSSR